MYSLLVALALSGFQTPAEPSASAPAPPSEAPAAAAAAAPAPEPEDRIVCHREHIVGSNRRQRVCMTVSERARIRDQSQDELRRASPGTGAAESLPTGRNGL
jgi:hypothetical protein